MYSTKTPSWSLDDNCVAKIIPLAEVGSGITSVRLQYLVPYIRKIRPAVLGVGIRVLRDP